MEDRTLVIGPAWIGDMVMAQALFKCIKVRYPDTQLDVLAPDWSRPLTERMPEIHQGLSMPLKHGELGLGRRYQLAKNLPHIYQRCYVLPNSLKSALIPFWAKIPHRIGWRGEWRYGLLNDMRVLDKQKYPLMVSRYAALAYEKDAILPDLLPKPKLKVLPQNIEAALINYDLMLDNGPIVALCPGAEFGPSKRWAVQDYAKVARYLIKKGYQVWIFGSAKDKEVSEMIADATDHECVDLCGRTTLADAIDLMSLSHCVITNDSGLMHIAAALGCPLVAIYGSTDPGFTPPLSHHVTVLEANTDCRPCFKRECPLKHHKCMKEIHPRKVIDAALSLMAG